MEHKGSHCTICGRGMADADARVYLTCYRCRGPRDKGPLVRDLSRQGTEEIGRKARDTTASAGCPMGMRAVDEESPCLGKVQSRV